MSHTAMQARTANRKSTKPANRPVAKPLPKPTQHTVIVSARSDDDPALEALVREIIARVADKWTMLVLEILAEHGTVRFTRIGSLVGGISQKMLTQTLRQMESDGLVTRTVHPVIPPHVDYRLTSLGLSLGEAFCGVWIWAEQHSEQIGRSRETFKAREAKKTAS